MKVRAYTVPRVSKSGRGLKTEHGGSFQGAPKVGKMQTPARLSTTRSPRGGRR